MTGTWRMENEYDQYGDGGGEADGADPMAFPTLWERRADMKVLSTEKSKLLATRNGWPLARAEGYIDGESHRRRGMTPSKYAQIGIDEYSLGFRAGFYERNLPGLTRSGNPDAPIEVRQQSARQS